MNNQIAEIPFHGQTIQTAEIGGKPYVAFRPVVESIGMDFASQYRRLNGGSWATVVKMTTVGADGKSREMTAIDVRTLTMWLATIDENRVSEAARPLVVAYQAEVADAIEAYWSKGGTINPRATDNQRESLMSELRAQMELAQMARGLVHADFLDSKVRIILARAMGETPELDPAKRPLYVQSFLKEKRLSQAALRSVAPTFGKRLKGLWTAKNGEAPKRVPVEIPSGRIVEVFGYTEADRPLMESIWQEHYAEKWEM